MTMLPVRSGVSGRCAGGHAFSTQGSPAVVRLAGHDRGRGRSAPASRWRRLKRWGRKRPGGALAFRGGGTFAAARVAADPDLA